MKKGRILLANSYKSHLYNDSQNNFSYNDKNKRGNYD